MDNLGKAKWQGFKNRAVGEFGENLVKARLEKMGYIMVEKVHTPWKPIRRGNRIVGAFPVEKVSGDFRAIDPGDGRSVLVEVKTKDTATLPFSAFEDHQILALDAHAKAGAVSLIAWVKEGQIQIHEWPIPGFGPGKSLPIQE